MAEHLFKVQQASNFDTATFNDSFLIFKKKVQLEQARKTIISSVDDLLNNSFVNLVKNTLYNVRDAFSTILLSDKKGRIRNLMESVLLPYVNMSDRDFLKISRAAVNTMFDWAMLNDTKYNTVIVKTLLGNSTEKSAARQILEFRDRMVSSNNPIKDNLVLKSLRLELDNLQKVGKPDNLYIAGLGSKTYDQNLIIDSFRQLREALGTENKDIYNKLVRVAVIQSGLTSSPISFTSLLPYEDFNDIYNNSLSSLEKMPTLGEFKKLNILERTNWSNSDIVPFKTATLVKNVNGGMTNINEDFINDNLEKAFKKGDIPKVINISVQSLEGRSDVITYSWQTSTMQDPNDPEKTIVVNKKTKADARRRGDYSYIKKGLFQKVYTEDKDGNIIPLLQITEYKDKIYTNYVYKMINAWGDSFRANESYPVIRHSKLDNGYEKVIKTTDEEGEQVTPAEVPDNDIVTIFDKPLPIKQKRENKSIILRGGMAVGPSELTEGLLDYLGYSADEIKELLNQYKPVQLTMQPTQPSTSIDFQEEPTSGYRERTIKNASADATIAIAYDFNSAGEKLTKSSVLQQNKLYLPVSTDVFSSGNDLTMMAGKIVSEITKLKKNSITLNIAGNGIYTLKNTFPGGQISVDKFTLELLTDVINRLKENNITVSTLRTGGQTGFDEAGAKAGIKLGIPTTILAPKGWTFRNISGQDISNEQQFKSRFTQPSTNVNQPEGLPPINLTSKQC
jgi:hypothetical protein